MLSCVVSWQVVGSFLFWPSCWVGEAHKKTFLAHSSLPFACLLARQTDGKQQTKTFVVVVVLLLLCESTIQAKRPKPLPIKTVCIAVCGVVCDVCVCGTLCTFRNITTTRECLLSGALIACAALANGARELASQTKGASTSNKPGWLAPHQRTGLRGCTHNALVLPARRTQSQAWPRPCSLHLLLATQKL